MPIVSTIFVSLWNITSSSVEWKLLLTFEQLPSQITFVSSYQRKTTHFMPIVSTKVVSLWNNIILNQLRWCFCLHISNCHLNFILLANQWSYLRILLTQVENCHPVKILRNNGPLMEPGTADSKLWVLPVRYCCFKSVFTIIWNVIQLFKF